MYIRHRDHGLCIYGLETMAMRERQEKAQVCGINSGSEKSGKVKNGGLSRVWNPAPILRHGMGHAYSHRWARAVVNYTLTAIKNVLMYVHKVMQY